jgi:hypothetical protein
MRSYKGLEMDDPGLVPLENPDLEWLRRKQNVLFPILPITSQEARQRFFTWIPKYISQNTSMIDACRKFAIDWNNEADGKRFFYISMDLIKAFIKQWEKIQNSKALEGLAKLQIDEPYLAEDHSMTLFMDVDHRYQPQLGQLSPEQLQPTLPASTSFHIAENVQGSVNTESPLQLGLQVGFQRQQSSTETVHNVAVANDRRSRVKATESRQRSQRRCRRCNDPICLGSSDIIKCKQAPRTPCKTCGKYLECPKGVDGGRSCSNN